ncbi:Fanconi anemia group B protein isoform X2 [Melanotaenia boesemani]|uniref:Fanconi anemia group B protein isoform X2 n=1 Tax=Melanotaenia boesemani TaxID=1250792 RepID=UPI001C04DCAF|nr:Fanconi anemia group B protein isoform X2 [Melanotaenia boesemani]
MERLPSEDLYRNPHRLSHCGQIISFNCKQDSIINDSETSELIFHSLTFEQRDNTFLKAAEGAAIVSRKKSPHLDIVTCKCAIDVQKRARTPCILVSKKSEKKRESFQYRLFTLSRENKLEPCIEFKLPYQIKDKVYILQGPTVLWNHEDCVFYTSLHAGGVKKIPIQMSHSVFGELPHHRGQVFVLGLKSPSEQCLKGQSTSPAPGYFLGDEQVFDGTMILPHPYVSITQCILVLRADMVDDVLNCAMVAATSSQQLVYFEGGIVKDVCQLPFEQAEDIQIVNMGRNGCLFVIFFHQGNVCTVWKDTFQVASCWSDVSSVHVDDFLRCGTDQILLAFKDQGETKLLKKFLITDLCGISYSDGQDSEAPKTNLPQPENYILTLQALESRLQSGLIVLQELQREVNVKDRVLQQAVQILTDVLSERKTVLTQHEQEGLVALWDCDDVSENETLDDKMQDSPALSSKPQIDKLWHRITEDLMVVGVILTSDSAVPVTSVSLSLLTETGQSSTPAVIQTQSQVFWLPAPSPSSPSSPSSVSSSSASAFTEPAAKRSKQHITSNDLNTDRLAVTAVTKLAPLLNSCCVKCRVMLHYMQKADAFSLLLKNPQLKTDEAREDFLSLLALLDRWVFHIDSPDYSLGDIEGWIQRRTGCKKIEVSPQYVLLDSSGPSALILLHWKQISPFQGELSIHSSQLLMFQFLDSLLAHLPPSCFIQPVKSTRCQTTTQALALALEKEIMSLRECASSLLCEEDGNEGRMGHEETPETGSVEGLQRCREVWQRDTERSKMRLSPLVDVGRYRKLLQSMCEVQMDGDLAVLQDTQRTLLS